MFLLSINLHDELEDRRIRTLVLTLEKIFDSTASHSALETILANRKNCILDDLNISTVSTLVI